MTISMSMVEETMPPIMDTAMRSSPT